MTADIPALVQLDRDDAATRLAAAVTDLIPAIDPKTRGYTTLLRALTDYEATR